MSFERLWYLDDRGSCEVGVGLPFLGVATNEIMVHGFDENVMFPFSGTHPLIPVFLVLQSHLYAFLWVVRLLLIWDHYTTWYMVQRLSPVSSGQTRSSAVELEDYVG